MSLRLRLSLFYTLLVALMLALIGLALDFSLRRTLYSGVDESLRQTSLRVRPIFEHEIKEGRGFKLGEEDLASLPPENTIVLSNPQGKELYTTRRIPTGIVPAPSLSTQQGWRVYTQDLQGNHLLVLRSLASVQDNLADFRHLLLLIWPVALGLSLGLGYLLVGRALIPAERLTRAAYQLAQSGNFQARLPEPASRDELWRVARAVNTLLAAQEQLLEQEKRFSQNASHELRTPLTVLRGRLERALETGDQAQLQAAITASDDLLGLVEKLLELSRVESGQALDLQPLALDELALEVAESSRFQFNAKGLNLQLELPDVPLWVQAEPFMLGLAIRNLLDNAAKFTRGPVSLKVGLAGHQVYLEVQDSGPGIAEEALTEVFERFYQSEVAHRQNGSGLGLALVKGVVERHGGRVWARNRPEGGAAVGFALEQMLYHSSLNQSALRVK